MYYSSDIAVIANGAQQIFPDLSDTFSVRKMQLLGGQKPPQDLLGGQRAASRNIGQPLAGQKILGRLLAA